MSMTDTSTDSDFVDSSSSSVGPGIDVPELIKKGLDNVQKGITEAAATGGAALGIGQKAAELEGKAAQDKADAQIAANKAEAAASVKLQADNAASAAILGNSPGAASRLLTEIGGDVVDQAVEAKRVGKDLADRKSVGFFDDPLQFLGNSFIIPFKEKELAQKEHNLERDLGVVQKVQERTSDAMKTNAAVDVADATAKLDALNKAALAEAEKATADSQAKLAALTMSAANIRLATTTSQYTAVLQAQGAETSLQHLALAKVNSNIDAAYKQSEISKNDLLMKEKSDRDVDRKDFEVRLNAALPALGMKPMNLYDFERASPAMRDSLIKVMSNQQITFGAIDLTPARALDTLEKLGSIGSGPGMAATVNKMNDWKVGAIANNPQWNTLKPEARIALEDNEIKVRANQEVKNIPSVGGIYSPAPLISILSMNDIVKSLPITAAMAPLAVNPQYHTNANDFINTATKLIGEGKETTDSASNQIAAIFKGVIADNNNQRQYGRLALSGLTDSFNMSVDSQFSGKTIINLADPTAIKNYLTREIIKSKSPAFKHAAPGINFGGTVP